jgi:hypothetical protein
VGGDVEICVGGRLLCDLTFLMMVCHKVDRRGEKREEREGEMMGTGSI